MMSLFSSFDMEVYLMYPFLFLMLFMFLGKKVYLSNKTETLIMSLLKFMNKFLYSLKTKNFQKLLMLVVNSIFLVLVIVNLTSILPFTFPLSSQLSVVLFSASVIWMSFALMSSFKSTKNYVSHLTPMGAPFMLIPFLFVIEVISNLIRPLTVSIRMVANILAGHLLMILLAKLVFLNYTALALYLLLNIAELAVALIQSYIFCTMLSLYYSEIS